MAVLSCAQIDTSGPHDVILNVMAVDEADYAFFQANWSSWFTNQRIQWVDELVAAPGYNLPVWTGWIQNPDSTWYDPNYDPDNLLD